MIKFEATIDDRVISTRVIDKQAAKERYDDAVAGGKAAVYAERQVNNEKEENVIVKLGNLMPKKTAVIKATIVA